MDTNERLDAPIITLLTDFGLRDGYVASMKGIILGICPEACLVDVSHLVAPQDIRAGAFLLHCIYRDFPQGTIHLVVVDPGVGTDRRGLVVQAGGHFFVGPDNGLFSFVYEHEQSWEARSLENPQFWRAAVSRTFHGRDVFAPVSAHLGKRISIEALGPICEPYAADWRSVRQTEGILRAEVLHIDHFGNIITNVAKKHLESFARKGTWCLWVAGREVTAIVDTYATEKPGTLVTLVGSSGFLEVALVGGHAAQMLGTRVGEEVEVKSV